MRKHQCRRTLLKKSAPYKQSSKSSPRWDHHEFARSQSSCYWPTILGIVHKELTKNQKFGSGLTDMYHGKDWSWWGFFGVYLIRNACSRCAITIIGDRRWEITRWAGHRWIVTVTNTPKFIAALSLHPSQFTVWWADRGGLWLAFFLFADCQSNQKTQIVSRRGVCPPPPCYRKWGKKVK